MSKYNHITEAKRQKIEAMLIFSPSQKHIAKVIGISEGGLSLEFKVDWKIKPIIEKSRRNFFNYN